MQLQPAASTSDRPSINVWSFIGELSHSSASTWKPFFRDAFRRSRCLLPASGYYEWLETGDGKQPYYFSQRDGQPLTFAGVYGTWHERAANQQIQSCAMVITEPNNFAAEVHDRMPVILEKPDFDRWMNGTPEEA